MIKIDKDIPLPTDTINHRNTKYPWKEMEIGNSFFSTSKGIPTLVSNMNKRSDEKYTSRKDNDGFNDGYRVWRIK